MNFHVPPASPTRILWLTAGPVSAAPLAAAVQLASFTDGWHVDVVAQGDRPGMKALAPHATLHVLSGAHLAEGTLSWELSEILAPCRLVHLLDPCCLAAGVALLLARLRGIPVIAVEPEVPAGLWAALDLRRLVACMVPPDAPLGEMGEVYRMVLAARREAA